MKPPTRRVLDVLARHGVAPDADAGTLLAEIAARGWAVQMEEAEHWGNQPGRARRFRAMAVRERSGGVRGLNARDARRGSGGSAEAALGRVLAAVLVREEADG